VDASGWRRQEDALATAYTVVTYDHRGVGHSGPIGESDVTIASLAEDAHALLEHLDLAPAVLVGSSMGAAIAVEVALAHPAAVRGLVLVSPVLDRDARLEAVLRAWRGHEAPASEQRVRELLPWLLGREYLAHAGRREAIAAAWRAMGARTPAATLRRHADAVLAWLGTRSSALDRIEAPALVVVGAEDLLAPPSHAESVATRLRAPLAVLEGAGHAPAVERADELNALVRDFVGRLA